MMWRRLERGGNGREEGRKRKDGSMGIWMRVREREGPLRETMSVVGQKRVGWSREKGSVSLG